jgi:hypothetical protein
VRHWVQSPAPQTESIKVKREKDDTFEVQKEKTVNQEFYI